MASRPIFIPIHDFPFVDEISINFQWHPGLTRIQAQKCILSLHKSAKECGLFPILEISSKSIDSLGVSLSAFNLMLNAYGKRLSVECAYQGSKVFAKGGPFSDLYYVSSREAKKDERIINSGSFLGYRFFEEDFPATPVTAFYDWLYLTALSQNQNLAEELLKYNGFSDIAFNPQKSLNCQARAAALFVALSASNEIQNVLQDKSYYFDLIKSEQVSKTKNQKQEEESNKFCQLELF